MEIDTKVKVSRAIRLIKSVAGHKNCFLAFSGGKDSMVLEFLCKEAGVKVDLMHNVTTIDPPGTISLCQRHGNQ